METAGETAEGRKEQSPVRLRASVEASEQAFLVASEVASVEAFLQGCMSAFAGAYVGVFGVALACTALAFQVGTEPQSLAAVALDPLGRTEHFHLEAELAEVKPPHPEE